MKKAILISAIFLATIVVCNAQYFAEGILSASYHKEKQSDGAYNPSSISININPKVGYWLSDDIAVGLAPYFVWNNQKIPENETQEKWEKNTKMWVFAVFGRYKLWEIKKISVLVECSIDFGKGIVKEKTGSISNFSRSASSVGASVSPALSYALTDKIGIIARVDFLSLSFHYETVKDKITDNKAIFTDFGFTTQSGLINYIGDFGIGLTYNF